MAKLPLRDPEEEHRQRSLRYYRNNLEHCRTRDRNRNRLKKGIPLDAPVKQTRPRWY
jgi:hypothetical protein